MMMVVMAVVITMVMVVVITMFMVMAVQVEALFFFTVYSHLEMTSPNAAFVHGFQNICDPRDSKRIQFLQHLFGV